MAVRKLGQILVDLGSINDDQLEMLVEEQSQSSGMIGRIAVNMGLISDEDLIEGPSSTALSRCSCMKTC